MNTKEPSAGSGDEGNATGAASAVADSGAESGTSGGHSVPPRPLTVVTGVGVALCLATALVHVIMIFFYAAPTNTISQRYDEQINSWVYPYFEQSWRLFAPNPQSVNVQISVRTRQSAAGGVPQIGNWFDLSAVDHDDVKQNVFPSHTTQNMLRRAWDLYLDSHGNSDRARSERASMIQQYLRNIAVERVREFRPGEFEAVQLRVITQPIAAPDTGGGSSSSTARNQADTRYLPWWEVPADGD